MSIIKILPENLVNQIAAGEVVERPSSVVKELVENSLDAGASKIVIEVKEAGKTLIKVADNGFGMEKEDAKLALHRHATSKLLEEKDLWNIRTMGFRGEALASISSVSQLTLKTRREKDISGTEINCDGGEIVKISETGMSPGTQIEVRSLFFNTPARQKYLKKESTELGHISALISTIALANPQIHFTFIHNDKTILDLPKTNDLTTRVADIFGRTTSEAMLPIFYESSGLKINGLIGKPVLSRSTSHHQYIFVNNRPIQHFLIANMVKEAFHSMLMEGKKPVFILNLEIDPAMVDVNVHPRKIEVRFADQQNIVRIIYLAVKTALEKSSLAPKAFTETQRYMSDRKFDFVNDERTGGREIPSTPSAQSFASFIGTENAQDKPKTIALSQVANSYIVAKNEDKIVLVDQHAAHERVRYEELMNQLENKEKQIQPLLMALNLELTEQEKRLLEDNMQVFQNLGFEIENFGGNTFAVNGVPSFLAREDTEGVIKGVIDDILNEKTPTKSQGMIETIINYMACRSAIKFGQKLQLNEMDELIKEMDMLKRPYTCPHGRPTMITLSLGELEKMFGRK